MCWLRDCDCDCVRIIGYNDKYDETYTEGDPCDYCKKKLEEQEDFEVI